MASTGTSGNTTIRVAVVVLLLNAGETTRAVEIASSLRDEAASRGENNMEIRFFSSFYSHDKAISYEHFVTKAGFEMRGIGPGMDKDEWRALLDREHHGLENYTSNEKAKVTKGLLLMKQALEEYNPTIVLHGYSPNSDGSICAHMLGVPNVSFLPLPIEGDTLKKHFVTDIPEEQLQHGLFLLPRTIRRSLMHWITEQPYLPLFGAQPTLRAAAVDAGWKVRGKGMLPDLLSADLALVNDLPGNFGDDPLPKTTVVTGPVFPHNDDSKVPQIDPEITRVFDPSHSRKVFVAMGSSGHKETLVEAIKALSNGNYHVVGLVPPTICSLEQFREELGNEDIISSPKIYLTDQFVPAKAVNAMADVAIIHGGQGTVQTAMGAGTPIVGTFFQPEQQFNVRCVENRGAGIVVEQGRWKAATISAAVESLFNEPSFQEGAKDVCNEMKATDGARTSAEQILAFAKAVCVA